MELQRHGRGWVLFTSGSWVFKPPLSYLKDRKSAWSWIQVSLKGPFQRGNWVEHFPSALPVDPGADLYPWLCHSSKEKANVKRAITQYVLAAGVNPGRIQTSILRTTFNLQTCKKCNLDNIFLEPYFRRTL